MANSVYDENRVALWERGYFPLPIGPNSKSPMRWTPDIQRHLPCSGWQKRPTPIDTPQPGAGIGVRTGNGLIAVDYDDEAAALIVSDALGDSPVNKAGQTAWTSFF